MQLRAIDFLREVAGPYAGQVPALLYAGIVGPRGDAYEANRTITAEEAEEYHSEQLATLARAGVDLVEADDVQQRARGDRVGPCRSARGPAALGLVHARQRQPVDSHSGPTLKDAIETIDAQTGDDRPTFYGINCSHPLEFMPAIEPGSLVRAGAVSAPQCRDDGQDFALHARAPRGPATPHISVNSWAAWLDSTRTSTCGAAAAARGKPTSTRLRATCARPALSPFRHAAQRVSRRSAAPPNPRGRCRPCRVRGRMMWSPGDPSQPDVEFVTRTLPCSTCSVASPGLSWSSIVLPAVIAIRVWRSECSWPP